MVATRAYMVNALRVPAVAVGIRSLMQARCGAFVTAERAAEAMLIDGGCRDRCPFCLAERPETLRHLLLKCPAWTVARNTYLRRLIKYVIPQLVRERGNDQRVSGKMMVTLLLGGSVAGVTLGGLWSGGRQFARRSAESARRSRSPLRWHGSCRPSAARVGPCCVTSAWGPKVLAGKWVEGVWVRD